MLRTYVYVRLQARSGSRFSSSVSSLSFSAGLLPELTLSLFASSQAYLYGLHNPQDSLTIVSNVTYEWQEETTITYAWMCDRYTLVFVVYSDT